MSFIAAVHAAKRMLARLLVLSVGKRCLVDNIAEAANRHNDEIVDRGEELVCVEPSLLRVAAKPDEWTFGT